MNAPLVLDRWLTWPRVWVLALLWAWVSWLGFQSFDVAEDDLDAEVLARYYDRELRLQEGAGRSGPYGRWIADVGDDHLLYQDILDALDRGHAAALGDDGGQLRRLVEAKAAGGGEEPAGASRDDLLAGDGHAWQYETFIMATGDQQVAAIYQKQNDRLMSRVVALQMLLGGAMLAGIACALWLWRSGGRHAVRPHRMTSGWSVRVVLGTYFALNLLLLPWGEIVGFCYDAVVMVVPESPAYVAYDVAYRAFDAGVFVLLFLGRPSLAWRFFGQGRGVAWRALLAVFGVQSLLEFGLFHMAPLAVADPTDFLEVADPDAPYLLSMWFSAVVVAPLCEEIVFRGFLFQGLRGKLGTMGAGLLSTLLFALAHAQYDIWGLLAVSLTGAGAAYLTLRTGSLTSAIAYHAILNAIACGGVYFQYQLPL